MRLLINNSAIIVFAGFEDAVSVASVNAAASAYVKQTTEKIGLDAGMNLHDDTLLQKKEIDRTKFLG